MELGFYRNTTNIISNDSPNNSNLTFSNTGAWKVAKWSGTAGNDTLELQGTSTGTGTIMGKIVDESTDVRNKTSLTVDSAGVWRLTNNNTFSGTTTVRGGTLIVDGSLEKTSLVQVQGGRLGGNGSINQAALVTVGAQGVVVPGNDGEIGQLNIGSLALKSGGACQIDFNGSLQTIDFINAAGAVDLGDGVALLLGGMDLAEGLVEVGTSFTILQSMTAISGRFANDELWIGNNLFQIEYASNAVSLVLNMQNIPEPNTVALSGLGLLLLLALTAKKARGKTAG